MCAVLSIAEQINTRFRVNALSSLYQVASNDLSLTALKALLTWQLWGSGPLVCNVGRSRRNLLLSG